MKKHSVLCMWFLATLEIFGNLSVSAQPKQSSWAGFYDNSELAVVEKFTISDIKAHFNQNIWPVLTPAERQILRDVQFSFPIEASDHPMNFFRFQKQIILPQNSLRFLRDICLAFAYANRNQYSEQVIVDYLAILKYQWPLGHLQKSPYNFGEALGIPKNALENQEVNKQFGSLYTSSIYFILCHELGHVFYNHGGYMRTSDSKITKQESINSQIQEKQADAFSLDILQRIGAPPFHGIITFFFAISMLEPYPDEINFRSHLTHPLTSDRILAVARNAESSSHQYARLQPGSKPTEQIFLDAAKKLRIIADILSNGGMQEIIRSRGQNGNIDDIGFPTKKKLYPKTLQATSKIPFVGEFFGKTFDNKEQIPLKFSLTEYNGIIRGSGSLLENGPTLQIKDGHIKKDTLFFGWHMGDHYFGEGKLVRSKNGKLIGRWWTKKSGKENTVGTIELRPVM